MVVELAVVSTWLLGLTVATLAVKRETMFLAATAPGNRVPSGPPLGAAVGNDLGPAGERRIVVFLDADCPPCHDFARDLNGLGRPSRLTVSISGPAETAAAMAASVPRDAALLLGAEADRAAEQSRVTYQPFALAVANGIVVGKSYPTSAQSLESLFREEDQT